MIIVQTGPGRWYYAAGGTLGMLGTPALSEPPLVDFVVTMSKIRWLLRRTL